MFYILHTLYNPTYTYFFSGTPPLSPSSSEPSENSEKEKEEMEPDSKSNFQKTNFAGSILAN